MATTNESRNRLARLGQILSCETRLRIIELLRERPLCVNAIARQLDVTQAAASQHLRLLRDAGLVSGKRRGSFMHYSLRPQPLSVFAEFLAQMGAAPALDAADG